MPKIAISYRRIDSSAIAGRIADRLASRYGRASIFIDVDSVPFGTDFRKYIQDTWSEIKVLIVVVGPKWLGDETAEKARIHGRTDVVRIEVETALKRDIPIIPVLVDGAKMPSSGQLPKNLRAFADRNAAEVDGGRDFHPHMDRLTQAIDRIAGPDLQHHGTDATRGEPARDAATGDAARGIDRPASTMRPAHLLRDIAIPVGALVILHHLIVNALDLSTVYLRLVSFLVPLPFGMLFHRQARGAPAVALAVAAGIGIVAVAAMTISEGVNSSRPILPATPFEWRETIEYVASITLSFFAGYLLARSLVAQSSRKLGKS
jgi:TIR domain-containing protein